MRVPARKSLLRTSTRLVLLVALFTLCAARSPGVRQGAEASIVPDASQQVADEAPAYWGITGSNSEAYTLRTNRAVVLSGSASAVLEADPEADTSRFGALVQASSAAAFKGKRIELSAYIAAENALACASIWLRADDANGTMLAFDNSFARGVRGTAEWTYQNIVMDVPEGAVALFYGALLNGRGRLYVDDVQFRIVDASVPVTAKPITPQPHLAQGPASDPGREARNLDFEETSGSM